MRTLGFTGTRNCKPQQVVDLTAPWFLTDFRRYGRFVTGGCRGFDAIIGVALVTHFPEREHVVVVPANRSQVVEWWDDPEMEAFLEEHGGTLHVRYMPEGTNYRDRNVEIVKESDDLFFFADYPEMSGYSTRSGTWQTVRLARKMNHPIDGVVVNI